MVAELWTHICWIQTKVNQSFFEIKRLSPKLDIRLIECTDIFTECTPQSGSCQLWHSKRGDSVLNSRSWPRLALTRCPSSWPSVLPWGRLLAPSHTSRSLSSDSGPAGEASHLTSLQREHQLESLGVQSFRQRLISLFRAVCCPVLGGLLTQRSAARGCSGQRTWRVWPQAVASH